MVNYACAFSQSESGKYFEWIIIIINSRLALAQLTLTFFLLFISQCRRSPYGTYSSSRKIGSLLTQQPNMLTTFLWYPIDFMISISCRSCSLASSSVLSNDEKGTISIPLHISYIRIWFIYKGIFDCQSRQNKHVRNNHSACLAFHFFREKIITKKMTSSFN